MKHFPVLSIHLRPGLLLLVPEEGQEGSTRHLHHLEATPGNVTLRVAGTTETSNEHLVVLVDEVEATVIGNEGGDLLPVLDQLSTASLTDGGVGLLGLQTTGEGRGERGEGRWEG